MKVCLAAHNFPPEFRGGTEEVVLGLGRSLKQEGHEVLVLAGSERREQGGRVLEEHIEGLRVLRICRPPEENYDLRMNWPWAGTFVTRVLEDERPDFLHVHHWMNLGSDLLQRAAALGIPAGATLHDLWTACPRFFRRAPKGVRCPEDRGREACVDCVRLDLPLSRAEAVEALRDRDRRILRELSLARFLAVPSKAFARLIRRHLPWDGPLAVVPHGVGEGGSRKEAHGLPSGKERLRIGSFGNLVPEKGLDLLVEALANLGREVELVLAGHAPDGAYLESLRRRAAAYGIPFRWLGPFRRGEPHPAAELDLAVFPSLCLESYGLVVEEALLHGVPVVVSGRGALPERVERGGGLVVRAGGVMPLRVTLSRLVRDRRKIEELRKGIPERFPSIGEAAHCYLDLYLEAVET